MSNVALLSCDAHWVVLRRRVSLAGCVLRSEGGVDGVDGVGGGGGVGVSGGIVKLSALPGDEHVASEPSVVALANPTASRKAVAAPAANAPVAVVPVVPLVPADALVVQTPIQPTSLYVFFDLAAGNYLTGGCDERGLAIEAKRVTVPPPDRTRRPTLLAFDLLVCDPNLVSLSALAHRVAAA